MEFLCPKRKSSDVLSSLQGRKDFIRKRSQSLSWQRLTNIHTNILPCPTSSLQGSVEVYWSSVGNACASEAFQSLSDSRLSVSNGGDEKKKKEKKKSITASTLQKSICINLAKVIKSMTNTGFTFLCFQTTHKSPSAKLTKLLWN